MTNLFAFVAGVAPFLASIAEGVDLDRLTVNSLLGLVLSWFMLRAEKHLSGIKHQMAGLNRTMLIEILSRPGTSPRARLEARRELHKEAPDLAREMGVDEPGAE